MPGKISFEDAVKELELVVKKLEDGSQPLEKSLELFTKGTMMVSICREELKLAECKVRELTDFEGEIENE